MNTRNTTPVHQDGRELTVAEIEVVAGGAADSGNGIGNTVQLHIAAYSFGGRGGNGGSGGLGLFGNGGNGGAGGSGGSLY